MIDERFILEVERLRDAVAELWSEIKARYRSDNAQVTNEGVRKSARQSAEKWLVECSSDPELASIVGEPLVADLNVHFTRILGYASAAAIRKRYKTEIHCILQHFDLRVVIPLKQARGRQRVVPAPALALQKGVVHSAFIGQSFSERDEAINRTIFNLLEAIGIKSVTGEKPKAALVSEKVKHLIQGQDIFVGIFTRRDKIARRHEWTTSAWVIDEKAYAVGVRKPLILLKEDGVESIGGIQGDYEYLDFSRDELHLLTVQLLRLFQIGNSGLVRP